MFTSKGFRRIKYNEKEKKYIVTKNFIEFKSLTFIYFWLIYESSLV